MGSQRVGHNWVTELNNCQGNNQIENFVKKRILKKKKKKRILFYLYILLIVYISHFNYFLILKFFSQEYNDHVPLISFSKTTHSQFSPIKYCVYFPRFAFPQYSVHTSLENPKILESRFKSIFQFPKASSTWNKPKPDIKMRIYGFFQLWISILPGARIPSINSRRL